MNTLVLVPDLRRKGGVANFYRCLELNSEPNIDYFCINTVSTPSETNLTLLDRALIIIKVCYLPVIYLKFIFTAPRYQLIHINPSLRSKSFSRDMGFIVLSRLLRKKVLVFFRGWDDDYENKIKNSKILSYLFKNTYAKSDYFIILGQTFKNKLISLGSNKNKKYYLGTTIADSSYIEQFNIDLKIQSFRKEVNFLFLSRILTSKGIYIAIDSFEKCNSKIKNRKINLYIAGDGEELENAKKYAATKGLNNIKFVGYAKDELKKTMLLDCHIMVFPSFTEGLPNCVLEGMLYGMPIISRTIGGIPDVVEHGINGYLTESLDSDKFSEFCTMLIENESLYEEMARENFKKANGSFTTEIVKQSLLDIYDDISR